MNRSSRSVYTVTRSTYLPGNDEMSDIAYIDVDDDDDYVNSNTTLNTTQGNLSEVKHQVSDQQGDLSERGVFDYFSSPLTVGCSSTNRAQESSLRPQNHYYLGPGGASSLRSSGARKFVEAHRQADATGSSDEEVQGNSYESRWPSSSHKNSVHNSPSLDSQWVRQQYNQHVRQANTQCYDEAVPCDESDDRLTANRPLSPVADRKDVLSSRSSIHDSEHVLSRRTCSDTSHDVCDTFDCFKVVKDVDAFRDSVTVCSVNTDTSCGTDQMSGSPATHSFLLRSGSRSSKDGYDTHHMSTSGQSWPVLSRVSDSHTGPVTASHQIAVCRSSEQSTVVSAVGSVRCSTGVDTGVGFPLSTVSTWNTQGHADSSRLSSSGQSTVASGLDRVQWAPNNGLQGIADYRKNYDDASPHSYGGRPTRYEHLTLRKNNQDDDSPYLYSSRVNDSDGEDDARRSDADITSNIDILQRRAKDYDCGSTSTVRPYVTTPQYHLMPTEEEETERKQSAKGQLLERMQRRRTARRNRESAGISTADTVPGFRGEAPLEELIRFIDAPASAVAAASDSKVPRKSKKKKKKVSMTGNSDSNEQKLANSCEVFVGTSGVSSDEPSVRVGDSCCIELSKKSDSDSLPDTTNVSVDSSVYSPDSYSRVDFSKIDKHDPATSTITDGAVDADIDSQNALTDTDINDLTVTLVDDLPEVVYTEVKNTQLEEENVPVNLIEPAAEETFAGSCETATSSVEDNTNKKQTSTNVDVLCVEPSSKANVTDSVCGLVAENGAEKVGAELPPVVDKQHELDDILSFVTGSDSITSDTGSVEDMFVTVQKKKRTKNTAAIADDARQRFDRRSSLKGPEDRDGSYHIKRSWVKSSDTTSIVPSVSVSRSSIVYSKPLCPVSQKSSVAVARYSQASNPDTVLTSAAVEKCKNDRPSSSAATVNVTPEGITEQNSREQCTVSNSVGILSHTNSTDMACRNEEYEKKESASDPVTQDNSFTSTSADTVIAADCLASDIKTFVSECNKKLDSSTPSDMQIKTVGDNPCGTNVEQSLPVEVMACEKLNESAVKSDIQLDSSDSNPAEDEVVKDKSSEEKVKSSQLSVQYVSASDVFLDTRNIAGTTPPRSDISFGFDPNTSPETQLGVPVCQHDNPSGGTLDAVTATCHCPVVASIPPPVPGCAPVVYFYSAMPVPILPSLAPFTTGRCTPIGVVPPMPAVADMSSLSMPAAATWQSPDDKLVSVPVMQQTQNVTVSDEAVVSVATEPSASSKPTNEFVLSAAQRFLYAGIVSFWTIIVY